MRILVLSPVFPDAPSDGDRLRLFHWLRYLSARHDLDLACQVDPHRAADLGASLLGNGLKDVSRHTWSRLHRMLAAGARIFGERPINVSSALSFGFAERVDGLVQRAIKVRRPYDAVFAYRLKMAPYALRFHGPRFLDYTDSLTRYMERRSAQAAVDGRGLARRLTRWQAQKLAAYEAWVAGQFDGLFVNAATDALALQAMAPRFAERIHVAANGVDRHLHFKKAPRRGASMVFVGHLAYAPNVEAVLWFAEKVLPLILKQRPEATFDIIGGDAPHKLLALAGRPGVRLHGYQSDTAPFLERAAISVVPVRTGAGRQNKLIEAFACGLPAVATRLAALGAEAVNGRHLLAADSAEDFAAAALKLLDRPALGRRLANQAAGLVKSKYDWARNAAQLNRILESRSR